MTFDEIINDFVILENLSSKHAGWIGYYYGKYYSELTNQNTKNNSIKFNFPATSTSDKFNIVMLNRNSELIYMDRSNSTNVISPINALINQKIIERFDPIQACYIGILSGASGANKMERKLRINPKVIQLKLIK